MKIQAILFDFDGTLADTMQRHFLCWKQTLEEVGVVINEGDYYPMEGSSLHKIAEKYTGSQEQQFINKLVVRKKKLYVDLYKHETLAFYPGSVKLIQFLTKKYPLAIVTAGHEDQLRNTAPKEFLNLFANLTCGDSVKSNKPSPEPYIAACKKLRKDPRTCVVVENAPLGVTSAIKAGCYCIGVESTCDKNQLSEAHETITDIANLLNAKVFTDQ